MRWETHPKAQQIEAVTLTKPEWSVNQSRRAEHQREIQALEAWLTPLSKSILDRRYGTARV